MTRAELVEQVTTRELMKDPIYKAWLRKPPTVQVFSASGKPWRVWAQRERGGGWALRDFPGYPEAFNFMAKLLRMDFHDALVNHKIHPFRPPVVMDRRTQKRRYHIPGVIGQSAKHRWCPHCRRPTVFTTFKRHHNLPSPVYLNYVPRCAVCGIAETAVRRFS